MRTTVDTKSPHRECKRIRRYQAQYFSQTSRRCHIHLLNISIKATHIAYPRNKQNAAPIKLEIKKKTTKTPGHLELKQSMEECIHRTWTRRDMLNLLCWHLMNQLLRRSDMSPIFTSDRTTLTCMNTARLQTNSSVFINFFSESQVRYIWHR